MLRAELVFCYKLIADSEHRGSFEIKVIFRLPFLLDAHFIINYKIVSFVEIFFECF
jgi:hypothetical protein